MSEKRGRDGPFRNSTQGRGKETMRQLQWSNPTVVTVVFHLGGATAHMGIPNFTCDSQTLEGIQVHTACPL